MPFNIEYGGVSVATLYFRDCPDTAPLPLQQFCVKGQNVFVNRYYYKFRQEWWSSTGDFEQAPWILDTSRSSQGSGTWSYDSATSNYISSGVVFPHNCASDVCSLDYEVEFYGSDYSSTIFQDYTLRKAVRYGYTMSVNCDTLLPPISFPEDPPIIPPSCSWEANYAAYVLAISAWRVQLALVITQNNLILSNFLLHNSAVPAARILYGSNCWMPSSSAYNSACVEYTLSDLQATIQPLPPFPTLTLC